MPTAAKISMLPAQVELTLYRGDSFSASFQLKSGGLPYDLTGSVVTADIHTTDGRAVTSFGVNIGAPGRVDLSLNADQTTMFPLGVLVWDLQVFTDPAVRTWVRGRLNVAKDVSV
jgi:hypothetical protein